MLVTCWSAKGGAGVTVVAATLAVLLGRRTPGGALLVDLGGDAPAVLGVPEPDSPGVAGWLGGGATVPADALRRLEIEVAPGVRLLPRGVGALVPDRAEVLTAMLADSPRPVVVDCGADATGGGPVATSLVRAADRSVLVIRPCYLALRRAMVLAERPTEVVLVREPGRVLSRDDVEQVVRARVVAEVELDPAVARAVDGPGLAGRLPRSLERGLRDAA